MGFLRILGIIVLIHLMFFLFAEVVAAKNYSDVPNGHKHATAISTLSDQQIVTGYPNSTFKPEDKINRAEAVKILTLTRFNQTSINQSVDQHKQLNHPYIIFPDVKTEKWFAGYVNIAHKNKIIEGYPDGLFKPSDHINFAEALKVILESHAADLNETTYKPHPLIHSKEGKWYEPYFTYAHTKNLINRNKFYHPGQEILRGEFVEIMYRLKYIQENSLSEFPVTEEVTSDEYTITIPKLNIINISVYFADIANEQKALDVLKKGLGHYLFPPGNNKKKCYLWSLIGV